MPPSSLWKTFPLGATPLFRRHPYNAIRRMSTYHGYDNVHRGRGLAICASFLISIGWAYDGMRRSNEIEGLRHESEGLRHEREELRHKLYLRNILLAMDTNERDGHDWLKSYWEEKARAGEGPFLPDPPRELWTTFCTSQPTLSIGKTYATASGKDRYDAAVLRVRELRKMLMRDIPEQVDAINKAFPDPDPKDSFFGL